MQGPGGEDYSAGAEVDSTAKAVVDSAKSEVKAVADSAKKEVKKAEKAVKK